MLGVGPTSPRARATVYLASGEERMAQQSWSARAEVLCDSVHELLERAVLTASTDADASSLNAATARFDTVAKALEADLIALEEAKMPRSQPMPAQLVRALAEREASCAPQQPPAAKRKR